MPYSGVGEDEAGKEGEAGNRLGFRCSLTHPAEAATSLNVAGQP
jgi:hypothetical protein